MKYKINDAYVIVNGVEIAVGVVLGQENDPCDPHHTEIIPISEYEKGLKEFRYGRQHMGNMVFYRVGVFTDNKSTSHVDEKWMCELERMGYNISILENHI